MMTKIIEEFLKTDNFKKELRESEQIPDFEKYLDERLSADEKTQLHKERFEIGYGSKVESKVHNMHMEFMRSDAKNKYQKYHFEKTRSIITIREIESVYRAYKDGVNNIDTDRYKEPEITAKTILYLLQKLNKDLSQKIIEILLEDNDISIQMYVWNKRDPNFSEREYRTTWEAMKRNFNLILIENGTKDKIKPESSTTEIQQINIQEIQDALEEVINKKSKPNPNTIVKKERAKRKPKEFKDYFLQEVEDKQIEGISSRLKQLVARDQVIECAHFLMSLMKEKLQSKFALKPFLNIFANDSKNFVSFYNRVNDEINTLK